MVKVVVIGSGNLAHHLIKAFDENQDINLVQVYTRNPQSVSNLFNSIPICSDLSNLAQADIYIIAVSDDAVSKIAAEINRNNRFVVHTSGGLSIESLSSNYRRGVFYPLQTFSKNSIINFKELPICLECNNASDLKLLKIAANAISDKVFIINTQQRISLHLSAVFANNFVNHLYQIATEICLENQVSFELLKPLIQETANKILTLSPKEAQTGPAKRNDEQTILAHLDLMTNENQKKIYTILTQSIQNNGN